MHRLVEIELNAGRANRVRLNRAPLSRPRDGGNLLLVRDRRIAVSYMIEALRIVDDYHLRVLQRAATEAKPKYSPSLPAIPAWSPGGKRTVRMRARSATETSSRRTAATRTLSRPTP